MFGLPYLPVYNTHFFFYKNNHQNHGAYYTQKPSSNWSLLASQYVWVTRWLVNSSCERVATTVKCIRCKATFRNVCGFILCILSLSIQSRHR